MVLNVFYLSGTIEHVSESRAAEYVARYRGKYASAVFKSYNDKTGKGYIALLSFTQKQPNQKPWLNH